MKEINIYYGYITPTFDANQHPEVQRQLLLSLIKTNDSDEIHIYCNSPYVLFYLTIIQAYSNSQIPNEHRGIYKDISIKVKHFEVLKSGTVVEGGYYKDMITDENILNDYLGKSNDEYSDFLDLQQKFENKTDL